MNKMNLVTMPRSRSLSRVYSREVRFVKSINIIIKSKQRTLIPNTLNVIFIQIVDYNIYNYLDL